MRALFLDFDGVLHPLGLQVTPGVLRNGKPLARAVPVNLFCWVGHLAELLRAHSDVVLVVHSTWRRTRTLDELALCLGSLRDHVVGATSPALEKHASIQDWLEQHGSVEDYLVMDDVADEFAGLNPRHFVRCDALRGLSEPRVQEAVRAWLSGS